MDNREPGWYSALSHTQEELHWYDVDWDGPIPFGDTNTDESVVIPPIDNPLSPAVQAILLQEIDPDNDDVDPEQMYMAVCAFVHTHALTFKFFVLTMMITMQLNDNVQAETAAYSNLAGYRMLSLR